MTATRPEARLSDAAFQPPRAGKARIDDPPSPRGHPRRDRLPHLRRRRIATQIARPRLLDQHFSIAATMASCAARPAVPPWSMKSMKSSISAADQIMVAKWAMFWP